MSSDLEFQEHAVRLNASSASAVRDAFSALPRRGCLECVCRWEQRLDTLAALEDSGAFAIHFEPLENFSAVRIIALKGKSGPCYDTGRRAMYLGGAAAVLDDDRHLIVGAIRVCEKTGNIYTLWPYRDRLSVTEADPKLLARLECDPVPFDCSTFDADSQRLQETVGSQTPNAQRAMGDVAAIYPGPFRALVLKDGSVVRRGVATLLSEHEAQQNGLLRLPLDRTHEARPCECYAQARGARGAAFILETLMPDVGLAEPALTFDGVHEQLDDAALAALRAAPRDFKQRLLQLIEAREPYWVLTGSDPAVAGGCCPSTQVGVANRLVRAGALQSYAPPAPPDACTATFYAFPGEVSTAREPSFRICEDVRHQAAAALRDNRGSRAKHAVRVGLLILLGVSLGLSAWRTLGLVQTNRETRLCAVCATAERLAHRLANQGTLSHSASAVALGAVAAVQPCALAFFAGAVAVAWKPGVGVWTRVRRNGSVAAGAGLSNAALAATAAWGLSRVLGDMSDGIQAFRGPLMVLAGLPLTGLFQRSAKPAARNPKDSDLLGLFLLGATLGVLWCPVNMGLFAGVLLPAALQHGTPLRDAVLYGAGYATPLFIIAALTVAGGHLSRLRSAGCFLGATAGWGLIFSGLALAFR